MQRVWIAVGLVASLGVAVVLAAVAEPDPPVQGKLYLTNEKLKTQTTTDCNIGTYALNVTNGSLGKTYVGRSAILTSCAMFFEFNLTQETKIEGNVTANLLLGCDSTTVLRTGAASLTTIRAEFMRNAILLNSAQGSAPSPLCTPGTKVLFELVIPNKASTFKAGDRVVLKVSVWALTGDETLAKNVHLVVGGPNASSLEAVGLPVGGELAPPDENGTGTPGPGGNASAGTSPSSSPSSRTTATATVTATATETATATTTATVTTTTTGPNTTTVTVSSTGPPAPNADDCPSPCPSPTGSANNTTAAAASLRSDNFTEAPGRPAGVSAAQRSGGGRSPGPGLLVFVGAIVVSALVLAIRRRA